MTDKNRQPINKIYSHKNSTDMNTKIFTFSIILFLLLGSAGTFAQQSIPKKPSKKGNINYGLRYGWRGNEIIRQY